MKSNWLDKEVSLYKNYSDNIGRATTFRDILFTRFGTDLNSIVELRKLNRNTDDYTIQAKTLKSGLQCFTPAALMETKAKGLAKEISRSGMMQLDFDWDDIKEYDLEELKQCVFSLPFIAFCGLSCSGYGFYALALIAEPERLSEYAEHCFENLKADGIKPDESKGKKPENLRYVSYDANMLIRMNPEPLRIARFKTKMGLKQKQPTTHKPIENINCNALVMQKLTLLRNVQKGSRWATVGNVAYTLGGLGNVSIVEDIKQVINSTSSFIGEEVKYLKCAEHCFAAGGKALFS